jgi:hypothetical protein
MKKYSLAKKSGKNFCDELWGKLVRLEFEHKCSICNQLGTYNEKDLLNPHHLISRRVYKYRWDVENGLLLCPKHHEFDLHISAHTAPWGVEDWVKEHRPKQYAKWVENRQNIECDTKYKYKYEEIYHRLEEQYKAKTGEYYMIKRISMYLLSKDKAQIVFARKMQGASIAELARKYSVTNGQMKKFLEA